MNKYRSFFVYLTISILFIIIQTSLISPKFLKAFTPDLNLIIIIYLATTNRIYGSLTLTIINGLLIDIFGGNTQGLNILIGLVVYTTIKGASTKFDLNNPIYKIFSILLGTIIFYALFFIVLKLKHIENMNISFSLLAQQTAINTVVGTFIIILFNRINAKL